MGREERINDVIEQAELERLVGPVRPFGATSECDKCGLERQHFALAFCQGTSLSNRGDQCKVFGEHLHVMCPRCHYGWHERCRDYVDETAALTSAEGSHGA